MYLRWTTQRYQKRLVYEYQIKDTTPEEAEHVYNTVRLTLRLVTSTRVDGKPRQRTVAYLGSFNESKRYRDAQHDRLLASGVKVSDDGMTYELWGRARFWREMEWRLADLVEQEVITADQNATFTAQIAERIPQLTADERVIYDAEYAAGKAKLAAFERMFARYRK